MPIDFQIQMPRFQQHLLELAELFKLKEEHKYCWYAMVNTAEGLHRSACTLSVL